VVGLLRREGVAIDATADAEPLTGGVSSDIWRIATATGSVCVKRALPTLRTAVDWTAPVSRSASEARWLIDAAAVRPDLVPNVLAFAEEPGVLVLEYLDPADWTQWKAQLLAGDVTVEVAARLGTALGDVHRSMVGERERYRNDELFAALRLEPYIRYTAAHHPAIAAQLEELDDGFDVAASTVVHGDVSPKNVLVGPDRVILLDAECATWGDPAFDLGFFLTHLCAKAVHLPAARSALRACAHAYVAGYDGAEADGSAAERSSRAARWLPAILLARVDGRSPLEYLTDDERATVRAQAICMLGDPETDLASALDTWFASVP